MTKYKLFSWSAVFISVVLLVLPRIFPICNGLMKNGGPMKCHYAYQAEFIITLLAVILSAALLVLRTNEARLLTGFIVFLLGIIVIVLPQPWAIGICEAGACGKTTFFATIGGGLLALAGAGIVGLTWKSKDD
ncbi:MAG TPA: DUF4418 family protein [Methylomusa anaerophila]|uniref:DUF4418 domain-containing protein n=1 Tax=Methylomusa anaerophila TaxID=1930071 RepID=A0A348AEI3_9FIRM|nr:DUF4418 family protein [Methylomusa anaerophila]BBB89481.1 hypothetical protein MAMMFC1_00114 [Methylomusa anaerophila]HML89712.1 DUF4418 family protein [Methylomusa anaerophila]